MDPKEMISNLSLESPMSPSISGSSESMEENASPEFQPAVDFVQGCAGLQSSTPLPNRPFKRSPASSDEERLPRGVEISPDLLVYCLNPNLNEVEVKHFFSEYGRLTNLRCYYDLQNCFNGRVDVSYWDVRQAYMAMRDIERIRWVSGNLHLTARLVQRSPGQHVHKTNNFHDLMVINLNRNLKKMDVKAFFSEYGNVKNIRCYFDQHNCFNGRVDVSYWHIANAHAALKGIERIRWASGNEQLKATLVMHNLDSVNEEM